MDAFISHSSRNREVAGALEKALEADGLSVWLDESEIQLGALLGRELQSSILECRVLVLLWSAPAAESRYVNAEWLMGVHQDRLVLPCTLDATPLPQCLATNVFLDVRKTGAEAAGRLARAIRDADGGPTPLAPLMRGESPELAEAIATIRNGQQEVSERLGAWELDRAAAAQAALDPAMDRARARWPLDPMIVNLDGYHFKNAFMVEHWDAINAGRAPQDPVLERAERRFFETLFLDPTDPSALNGLGNVLFFQRDLYAAEFFHLAAIAAAKERGMSGYAEAEHDLALVRRYLRD